MWTRPKWFIGVSIGTAKDVPMLVYTPFKSDHTPVESDNLPYLYCIGPFKTRRGAEWAKKYGKHNPHFTGVDAAEKFAAIEARKALATASG